MQRRGSRSIRHMILWIAAHVTTVTTAKRKYHPKVWMSDLPRCIRDALQTIAACVMTTLTRANSMGTFHGVPAWLVMSRRILPRAISISTCMRRPTSCFRAHMQRWIAMRVMFHRASRANMLLTRQLAQTATRMSTEVGSTAPSVRRCGRKSAVVHVATQATSFPKWIGRFRITTIGRISLSLGRTPASIAWAVIYPFKNNRPAIARLGLRNGIAVAVTPIRIWANLGRKEQPTVLVAITV